MLKRDTFDNSSPFAERGASKSALVAAVNGTEGQVCYTGEKYSPIKHVAFSLARSLAEWEGVILGMFTAAFDAGGDEARPILTIAGFLAGAKDWDEFSKLWTARLKQDGIDFFHAVEAAHFREQFQQWRDLPDREARRQALFADLMHILKRHVSRKFGCTVINKHFSLLSEENRKNYKLRAYSVAGRSCDKEVRLWALENRIKQPVQLVFESGDRGRHELNIRLMKDTGRAPDFRPKKDTVNRKTGEIEYGFVPLQAADWLAYEISDAHENFELGKLDSYRWPMEEFNTIQGEPTTYTESDMEEMDALLNLNTDIVDFARHLEKIKKR